MENDVADAIETDVSTNNEGNEEDSIPVELVDKEERFHDGYGDEGPRFRTCRPVPIQQQKSTSDHIVFCQYMKTNIVSIVHRKILLKSLIIN